jgi:N-methylhydantoinase B
MGMMGKVGRLKKRSLRTMRMRSTILRSLASRALIDQRHVACAIATTDAQVVQIDNAARLGVVRAVVRSVLAAFDGTLADGDIVLTNDPFSGGTHLQDVSLVTPLLCDGQVVGYGIVQVPLADIGGMALGGYYPHAVEIWAEGVRVTPVKFYRGGHLQRDVLTMLLLNSRLPHLIEKDLTIMVGALEQCRAEVAALASQHPSAGYGRALQGILATTAARAREALQALSPGAWSGESSPIHCCLEDREFRVVVRLSVADGAISLDFSGSTVGAKGFINTTVATTTAAALMPF